MRVRYEHRKDGWWSRVTYRGKPEKQRGPWHTKEQAETDVYYNVRDDDRGDKILAMRDF